MEITHVIRGDDHISNTPKQVLLFEALGAPVPQFAHVPLILGTDKKRLSKRHGATSVMEYPRLGLPAGGDGELPRAARLVARQRRSGAVHARASWSQRFALDGISGGNAVFNPEKLDWFNQQHIMRLPAGELVSRLDTAAARAGLWRDSLAGSEHDWLERVVELLKPRARKIGQVVEDGRMFLVEDRRVRPDGGEEVSAAPGHGRAPGGAHRAVRDDRAVRAVADRSGVTGSRGSARQ